jgi:hypothetical protein
MDIPVIKHILTQWTGDPVERLLEMYPDRDCGIAESTVEEMYIDCYASTDAEWRVADFELLLQRLTVVPMSEYGRRQVGFLTRAVDELPIEANAPDIRLVANTYGPDGKTKADILTMRPTVLGVLGASTVLFDDTDPPSEGRIDPTNTPPNPDPSPDDDGSATPGPQLTLMDGGLVRRVAAA